MIPLPIAPQDALQRIIGPAIELLPAVMGADEARLMLLAAALQESGLNAREQQGGPARGLWQFEQGGGVWGVMHHEATAKLARALCAARGCPATVRSVYLALANDDVLAAGMARLLLWTDPEPLPALHDEDGAWRCYVRCWRPGKPRPVHWIGNYRLAMLALAADDDAED